MMRTYRDAKAMAKTLRNDLGKRQIALSHSECLEIVSQQLGFQDWNVLSARIDDEPTINSKLRLPTGWITSGSKPEYYEMGIDLDIPGNIALIRCKFAADDPVYATLETGFGPLMQSVNADPFRGKRLRLTAELKTEDVPGAATLWMRIDGEPGRTLRFDNMEQRATNGPLKGTAGWNARHVVLDVPEDALSVHFGFYQRGTGQTWARRFELSEMGENYQVTSQQRTHLEKPTNLDFSSVE